MEGDRSECSGRTTSFAASRTASGLTLADGIAPSIYENGSGHRSSTIVQARTNISPAARGRARFVVTTEDDVIALLKRTCGFDDLQSAFVLAMQVRNFSEVKAQMLALELSKISGRTGP